MPGVLKSLKIRAQALSPFTHLYVLWRTLVAKAEMYWGGDRQRRLAPPSPMSYPYYFFHPWHTPPRGGGQEELLVWTQKGGGALIKICLMVVVIKCESYRTGLKIWIKSLLTHSHTLSKFLRKAFLRCSYIFNSDLNLKRWNKKSSELSMFLENCGRFIL